MWLTSHSFFLLFLLVCMQSTTVNEIRKHYVQGPGPFARYPADHRLHVVTYTNYQRQLFDDAHTLFSYLGLDLLDKTAPVHASSIRNRPDKVGARKAIHYILAFGHKKTSYASFVCTKSIFTVQYISALPCALFSNSSQLAPFLPLYDGVQVQLIKSLKLLAIVEGFQLSAVRYSVLDTVMRDIRGVHLPMGGIRFILEGDPLQYVYTDNNDPINSESQVSFCVTSMHFQYKLALKKMRVHGSMTCFCLPCFPPKFFIIFVFLHMCIFLPLLCRTALATYSVPLRLLKRTSSESG
jgi:hypothetical protein